MIKKNNTISSFQMLVIGTFISNAMFIGMGNIILVVTVKQNAWIIALICLVIGILPILLLNKIFDYEPDLNIFQKTKKLFNKWIGNIINIFIALIALAILILNIWSITNFANTKYLTETPFLFIAVMLVLPALYATIKGIETIARTTEILFYFAIIIQFIIVTSLFKYISFDNVMPIFDISLNTTILGILKFLSYILVPFLSLLIIPKNKISDNKNLKKSLILGYILGAVFMSIVFFLTMSVLGINLLPLYRYPEYYIIKKVSIGTVIDNIENFLSVHWIFNLITTIMLNIHLLSEFVFNNFKVKNVMKNIIIMLIGLSAVVIANSVFKNTTTTNNFMSLLFPKYIALPALIIVILLVIFIVFKKKKQKT